MWEKEAFNLTTQTGGMYVCSLGSLDHSHCSILYAAWCVSALLNSKYSLHGQWLLYLGNPSRSKVEVPRRWCVCVWERIIYQSGFYGSYRHKVVSHSPMPRQVVRASHARRNTACLAIRVLLI